MAESLGIRGQGLALASIRWLNGATRRPSRSRSSANEERARATPSPASAMRKVDTKVSNCMPLE